MKALAKKILIGLAGILVVVAVGFSIYVSLLFRQIYHVTEVCNQLPPGTQVSRIGGIVRNYDVRLTRNFQDKNRPGKWFAVICADLTFCETSCLVSHDQQVITESKCTYCDD